LFADDAGAAMTTGNMRNLLARTLLSTTSANAGSMRSIVGQLKIIASVDITSANSVLAGVFGYLEIAGDTTFGGEVAAGEFTVEGSGDITVSSGAILAGVASRLNMASGKTITETGDACAFFADATGALGDKWPRGFYAAADSVDVGVYVGKHGNSGGEGLALGTITTANRFHADDAGAAVAAGNLKNVLARTNLTTDSANAASVRSLYGQVKLQAGVDLTSANSVVAPVFGYLEIAGDSTLAGQVAAVEATIESAGDVTVSAGGEMYGVASRINFASGKSITSTGWSAAYFAGTTGGAADLWDSALHLDGVDNLFSCESSTAYEDSVKVADGVAGDTGSEGKVGFDALARVDVAGTAYYIALFDAGSVTSE
jgi:hypothetical protein